MTSSFDWSGRVGNVWADEWQRTDRSFADMSRHLDAAILAAAPDTGRAIDIGCGAGSTSIALAIARPGVSVEGIDLSPALVDIARERGSGLANLSFGVADARSLGGSGADLLVSRHGVMFFDDPVAGFAALRDAVRPGGTLVFSCFRSRENNHWSLVVDAAVRNDNSPPAGYAPGPYGLADHGFTAAMLAEAGWTGAKAEAIDFTYVAGAGDDPVADALGFMSRIGSAARVIADGDAARQSRPEVPPVIPADKS